jgi:hypothetical protein
MLEATRRSRPLTGNAVRLMPAMFHPAGQDARSDGHSVNPTSSLQEHRAGRPLRSPCVRVYRGQ